MWAWVLSWVAAAHWRARLPRCTACTRVAAANALLLRAHRPLDCRGSHPQARCMRVGNVGCAHRDGWSSSLMAHRRLFRRLRAGAFFRAARPRVMACSRVAACARAISSSTSAAGIVPCGTTPDGPPDWSLGAHRRGRQAGLLGEEGARLLDRLLGARLSGKKVCHACSTPSSYAHVGTGRLGGDSSSYESSTRTSEMPTCWGGRGGGRWGLRVGVEGGGEGGGCGGE